MNSLIATSQIVLIIGLGVTGLSVARYLTSRGKAFFVADMSPSPAALKTFQQAFPDVQILTGEFDYAAWRGVSEIVLSPGVPRSHPAIAEALADGIDVVGDVELFVREAQAPIIAITGSNGKTTVTTLVGEMAVNAGVDVRVGGNLGTPALDLIDPSAQLYVLELSSFQLESTSKLAAEVATVLNVTPDHMDRYASLQTYHMAKQRVYFGARKVVVNRDDMLTQPPLSSDAELIRFGLGEPDLKDFGVRSEDGVAYLAQGLRILMPATELKMRGAHNTLNALAALALGRAAGLSEAAMVGTLRHFRGLPHRCEFVGCKDGVAFYNDSKATNVGATLAAVRGMASDRGKLILIAGGDGKGASFDALLPAVREHVRALMTIGVDGRKIAAACGAAVSAVHCASLEDAVKAAYGHALPGDIVILSPACASFDMFKGYEDRGHQFIQLVEALCKPPH